MHHGCCRAALVAAFLIAFGPPTTAAPGPPIGATGSQTPLELNRSPGADPVPVRVIRYQTALRERRGMRAPTVRLAAEGQVFPGLRQRGDWILVQDGNRKLWTQAVNLRRAGARVHFVIPDGLSVRSGPGTRFRTVGSLQRRTWIAVRGRKGPWRSFDLRGRRVWIHGAHLSGTDLVPKVNARSSVGLLQMPSSGPGYYGYVPSSNLWGRPAMVYGLMRTGKRLWQRGNPRLGVGDISLRTGGFFSPHASHQRGVDADLLPVRRDNLAFGVTHYDAAYSRARTQQLINILRSEMNVTLIFFNDSGTRGTRPLEGHSNHLHVRIAG